MKAIILAAGRGSRMNHATADIPKCMMKLSGKTLIDYGMESLLSAGFSPCDIGIVTGYKSEKIQIPGVKYFHNPDWETTNMFFSLTMARQWLLSEKCIVCYADIVYHPSAVTKLIEDDNDFAITYYTDFLQLWNKRFENPLDDLETLKLIGGRLAEIGGKPDSVSEIDGQYMGLLSFTPRGWAVVEQAVKLPMNKSVEKLDMTSLLQHLINQGHGISAIPTDKLWLECDNLEDIRVYEQEFFKE